MGWGAIPGGIRNVMFLVDGVTFMGFQAVGMFVRKRVLPDCSTVNRPTLGVKEVCVWDVL